MTTTNAIETSLALNEVVEACRLDGYDNQFVFGSQLRTHVVEACRLDGYDNSASVMVSMPAKML